MWGLVIVIFFALDGGGIREERLTARVSFQSQAECASHGAAAVGEAAALPSVVGAGFVCAQAPGA